ncbi:hypothetical protein dsx2_2756 [Desulfovibrio sp. X2]|uniref:YkgJ family cysteine cluster protein n=1 Tax=Desulfovibrio sp. X2 TaxID=941449 RepID=UPI000358C864|nr:hypothetical protein [Desulfovibrio sp. X2]EPR42839.1 hypothetical protein dsx2_2756 [Desulfovibrio sp. X2]
MNTGLGGPEVCARCAALTGSCCKLAPGHEEACFPLSEMEMDRIRDFTGAQGWFAQEANSEAFLSHMTRLFPGEEECVRMIFHPRKHHFRLATRRDGTCGLLGEDGCTLPEEVRPYYCRLFPLWYSRGRLQALAGMCLAVRESAGRARLLHSVHLSMERSRDLFARLRLAWGLPPEPGLPNVTLRLQRNPI